jgi:hypothetical protein
MEGLYFGELKLGSLGGMKKMDASEVSAVSIS